MRACAIRGPSIRSRRFPSSSSRGPASPARWIRGPITARRATRARAGSTGRKALITGGDSGIGRAAAIAFAREGADVAINYLPAEEPDAREVVAAHPRRGPQGGRAFPATSRTRRSASKLVADAVRAARRPRHPGQQRRAADLARLDPRHHDRAVRRDVQDQRLRDVLDHQGGDPAPEAGLRRSSTPRRSTPTIRARTSSTTPPPRARS